MEEEYQQVIQMKIIIAICNVDDDINMQRN